MSHPDRRQLLAALAAAPLAPAGPKGDLIERENARPGTTDWQLTYVRTDPLSQSGWGRWSVRSRVIEGYAGRASARAGEKLDLFVYEVRPGDEIRVANRDLDAVREAILAPKFNFGAPRVAAIELRPDGGG